MEAVVKFSLLFCVFARINAQITYAPPPPPGTAIVHHSPLVGPHVHVPVAVAPVAHVPVAHVAHVAGPHPAFVRILSQNYELAPDGSYTFQYEAEDGSSRQESGSPKFQQQPGVESFGGLAVQGRYAYASPEGPVEVQYTADENGYQPSGPSVHPAIQKAVADQVAFARSEGPVPPVQAYRPYPAPPSPQVYQQSYPSPPPSPAPQVYKQ